MDLINERCKVSKTLLRQQETGTSMFDEQLDAEFDLSP